MPAIAALTINDGQNTPAAHSFAVGTTDGNKAQWYEKSAGVVSGYLGLSMSVRMATSATGANSVIIDFNQPILGGVAPALSVVRRSSASLRFNFAQDASDQERKDLVAYITNFLSNAGAKAAIPALEPYY